MKTRNIISAVVVMFTMVVNAQTNEQIALSLTPSTTASCFHAGIKDGTPWSKKCGGVYIGLSGNYANHALSNNDGVQGTGHEGTFGGRAMLGHRWIRKNWPAAIRAEVFGGLSSSFDCENRRVGTNFDAGLTGLIEFFPHSVVHVGLGGEYEYRNLVSENANMVPWRGNAHYFGGVLRLTAPIASINQSKTVLVGNQRLNTVKKHEVNVFVSASYKFANVGKYWDDADAKAKGFEPELKDKLFTIEAGLTVNL
jgi:hypothetical protein